MAGKMDEASAIQITDDNNGNQPAEIPYDNPKEWSRRKKWTAVLIASAYTFISPVSSSMIAPAIPSLVKDIHFGSTVEIEMALSIFVLAYAVGPLILAPLSEVYGRRPILQCSLFFFVIFNTACGFAQTESELLLFRFLAGLGGSAPMVISGSVVADCFKGNELGSAMSYFGLGIVLGPTIGPVIGGFLTQLLSWRWLFWIVSIVAAVFLSIGTFLFPETYGPLIKLQAEKLAVSKDPSIVLDHAPIDPKTILLNAIRRPLLILTTQPIALVMALMTAFIYGVLYIALTTFSSLFTTTYGETTGISGLHYLALGFGFIVGNRFNGTFVDKISVTMQKRYNTPHKPEYRLVTCIPACIIIPLSLLMYGWSAEKAVHWIVPDLGLAIFCGCVVLSFQSITLYVVDTYAKYSASALAAVYLLRSVFGFGFPLFATELYDSLGYGWGNSLLAFIWILFGTPAPIILFFYGEKIRAKAKVEIS
ncbi:hypothetical protein HDU83_000869 [Entophlyctis luteolus]|nr:hypothetical protein HDU83_000869 [Entophlyctis luteolus]